METRRFSARPSAVSLEATGWLLPSPRSWMLSCFIPVRGQHRGDAFCPAQGKLFVIGFFAGRIGMTIDSDALDPDTQ